MTQLHRITTAIENGATDLFEKASSPGSRAGAVVERVGKMHAKGVDVEVIALQMSKSSPSGHRYTPEFVRELVHLAKDSQTRVVITAKQGHALILDQQTEGLDGAPCFA